ncbi:hypothetical protein HYH03_014453 [Edaphochlamys debaryana]|uniref:Glutamine amidotransferase type-2 domain-containing protein n=1 Tax=Edaphochlamys debaryana TaxID=47281 RepID=A0A836BS01_9CHLO|nr:hypothetical protein HYH03_014453 [Edaphochlamys debaryana]|eukprot:KAG2486956.1 hypothetical protein HYH03_014453 [Edaphochlamys debaryana]
MCGIALACEAAKSSAGHGLEEELLPGLRARGPDHLGSWQGPAASGSLCLTLVASLLQLRGAQPGACPWVGPRGHVLCFNGEVFGGLEVPPGANDGERLLEALAAAGDEVPRLLSALRGPWALLFWDPRAQRLWLGRDVLGRRSLLLHAPDEADPRLLMTSVGPLGQEGGGAGAPGPAAKPQAQGTGAAAAVPGAAAAKEGAKAEATAPVLDLAAAGAKAGANGCSGAAAGLGGSGSGGARAGGEGEDEEAEPSGTDGFWTELPPGVYDIRFGGGSSSPASAAAISAPGDTPGSNLQSPGCSDETGAVSVPYRRLTVGGTALVMRRHPWADPVLLQLEAYERPYEGGDEQAPQNPSSVTAVAVGKTAVGVPKRAAIEALLAGTGLVPQEMEGEEGKKDEHTTGDGATGAALQLPRALPLPGGPDAPALALLNVMLAALRVRCTAVEPRSPHPAAAFAAAAAAALGAEAQPSWRRPDPHDFTVPAPLPGAGSHVTGAAQVATPVVPEPAPVLILFSGGVDSVLIAALAHRALPPDVPIDLANVCFAAGTSPDRLAALSALAELRGSCPGRRWRLVEVDAVLEDADRHRARLLALLRPAGTVMDANIGAALWLAVAGQGRLRPPPPPSPSPYPPAPAPPASGSSNGADAGQGGCTAADPDAGLYGRLFGSAARVVLLGHGADEQCGGYGRHRTKFRTGGRRALAAELGVDMRRLWLRNLGRDDRLVADWGREARHPFLDEAVMGLVRGLPLECVADLTLPPGTGDKALLRSALALLGLPEAAARVKRAIQFGSRIGKLANRRDFGSNRAANRRNAGSVAIQDVIFPPPAEPPGV